MLLLSAQKMFLCLVAVSLLHLTSSTVITPPSTISNFCSVLHQYATVDTKTVANQTFKLCIAYPKWSQKGALAGGSEMRFNGTHRFDLTPNASAPGHYNCVSKYFGKPDPRSLPFGFITLDSDATFNHTSKQPIDTFQHVNIFSATRPYSPHTTKVAWMNWYVHTITNTTEHQLLRSACRQPASQVQPNATGQSIGIRDFGQDFVTPTSAAKFHPPLHTICIPSKGPIPPTPFVPATCDPTCQTDSLCCKDPSSSNPACCYAVKECSQVHNVMEEVVEKEVVDEEEEAYAVGKQDWWSWK